MAKNLAVGVVTVTIAICFAPRIKDGRETATEEKKK